jgi:hypothetical protein
VSGNGRGPRLRRWARSPRERFLFTKWWRRCERLAGLEHDQRWGFHSLRRQFATELKDEPLADVAALGGWKSTTTLLACYITADPATMKRALARRRALADARVESTNGEQKAHSQMHDAPRGIVTAHMARCCASWASEELNLGPHAYQACALTT